ncbi:DUF6059 family protein [Streptomyces sp. SudanB135_2055]|uniref:DUF6059 family protein n=1 Tax=Streptomyces sp. SudanB135_2055 TaxID=3035279 RepID=UPI0036D78174
MRPWPVGGSGRLRAALPGRGETDRYDHPPRPRVRWHRPPPGHPERVRDDMPLTDLERRLARELTDEDHDVR